MPAKLMRPLYETDFPDTVQCDSFCPDSVQCDDFCADAVQCESVQCDDFCVDAIQCESVQCKKFCADAIQCDIFFFHDQSDTLFLIPYNVIIFFLIPFSATTLLLMCSV